MRFLTAGLLWAALLYPLAAQVPPAKIAGLERIAAAGIERTRIPALSVAIIAGDGPVWTGAWGFTDLENFVPTKPQSVFRLASISKSFTATAAMLLVEEGKLDLDAEVQRYVHSFPRKPWPITTRELLCHQAGIRHYQGAEDYNSTRHFASVTDALSMFSRDPLLHEPGTRYAYSSYGFNLVGAIVESIAGEPYAEFVHDRVLEPAGAVTMRTDDVYSVVPFRARGYQRRPDGSIENCALTDTSYKLPGGGWAATATDLVKFAHALMDGKILKPSTLERMWTPQKLKDGSDTGYAFGWNIQHKDGLFIAQHSGGQQGANTHLLLVPARKIAIAVLADLEDAGTPAIAHEMLDELLEKGK